MIKIIFLTILTWSDTGFSSDSLRLETINGKAFIIHQVGDHETLYGLSKRYGTPIASIKEYNPTVDAGLEIGQILKIPYIPKSTVVTKDGIVHKVAPKETLYSISKLYNVSPDDVKGWNNLKDGGLSVGQELIIRKKTAINAAVNNPGVVSDADKHTVEPKETLYSIARKYGVSVQQLKDWNSIQGNDVKMGDVLIVKNTGTKISEVKPMTSESKPVVVTENKPTVTETKPPIVETKPVSDNKQVALDNKNTTADVKPGIPKETPIIISEGTRGSDEVKEGGLAELIEGTEGNRKYLALHRTAKTGTIMKVRNELNNREVFVRVIGTIPDTGVNDKIVIKISKSAYDRLGAIDPKFRAEVTYYK
jgi:LysM repeat protein